MTAQGPLVRTSSVNALTRQSSLNSVNSLSRQSSERNSPPPPPPLKRPASFSSSPHTPQFGRKGRLPPTGNGARRRGRTPPRVPYDVFATRKQYTWFTCTVLLVTVVYAFAAAGRRLGEVLSNDRYAKEHYGSWPVIQPPQERITHIQELLGNSGRSCGTENGLLEARVGVDKPWWAADPYFPTALKCSFNAHEPRSTSLVVVVALEDDGVDAVTRWIDKRAIPEALSTGNYEAPSEVEEESGDTNAFAGDSTLSAPGGDIVFVTDSNEILGVLAQYGASVLLAITDKPFLKRRTSVEKQAVRIKIWNMMQDIGRRAGYEVFTIASSTSLASTSALAALSDAFTFDDHVTLVVPTTTQATGSLSNLSSAKTCRRYWAEGLESLKKETVLMSAEDEATLTSVDRVSHALVGAVPLGKRVELVGSLAAAFIDKTSAGDQHLCFEDCVFSIHLKRSVRFAPFLDHLFDVPQYYQESSSLRNNSSALENEEAAVAAESRRKRHPANALVLRMLAANIPIGIARRAYVYCGVEEDKVAVQSGLMRLASVEIPALPVLPEQTRTYQSVTWKVMLNSAIRSCDWVNNFIETDSVEVCKSKCSTLGKCKGFSYMKATRTCYLKSCSKGFHVIAEIDSYVKVAVPISHQDECVVDPINLGVPRVEGTLALAAGFNARTRRGHHAGIRPRTRSAAARRHMGRMGRQFRGHRMMTTTEEVVTEQLVTSAGGPHLDVIGDVGPVRKAVADTNSSSKSETPELRVAVLITVHDALEWVIKCILSIWTLTDDIAYTLYLINDQSNDATLSQIKYLTSNREGVRLVNWEAREPLNGYTRCINLGFRAARADAHYDAYCTLNSDVEVLSPHWLSSLAHAAFSSPKIGIVGPLSNAASYQSVPKLRETINGTNDWSKNDLPEDWSPAGISESVVRSSRRMLVDVPVLNGFCMFIKREVVDAVGLMDDIAFPFGFGEENDFAMRTKRMGYELKVFEGGYIWHHKSKSYGDNTRRSLSSNSKKTMKLRWGTQLTAAVKALEANIQLKETRRRVERIVHLSDCKENTLRVLFVLNPTRKVGQPTLAMHGGWISIFNQAWGLRMRGVCSMVAISAWTRAAFEANFPQLKTMEFLLTYPDEVRNPVDLAAALYPHVPVFDFLVATLFTTVESIGYLHTCYPHIHTGYFIQDYEADFDNIDEEQRRRAYESYQHVPGMVLFAKTEWLRMKVVDNHNVTVQKVLPSLDLSAFQQALALLQDTKDKATAMGSAPVSEVSGADPNAINVVAMVRPSTPRRNPKATLQVLMEIKEHFGPKVVTHSFGCGDDELDEFLAEAGPDLQPLVEGRATMIEHHGTLARNEVATLFAKSDIFLDMSFWQAFGRTGLEAMAAGCVPVLPVGSGSEEYSRHGINSMLHNTTDYKDAVKHITSLIDNRPRLEEMRAQALLTSKQYDFSSASLRLLKLFCSSLASEKSVLAVPNPCSDALPPPPPPTPVDNSTKHKHGYNNDAPDSKSHRLTSERLLPKSSLMAVLSTTFNARSGSEGKNAQTQVQQRRFNRNVE